MVILGRVSRLNKIRSVAPGVNSGILSARGLCISIHRVDRFFRRGVSFQAASSEYMESIRLRR